MFIMTIRPAVVSLPMIVMRPFGVIGRMVAVVGLLDMMTAPAVVLLRLVGLAGISPVAFSSIGPGDVLSGQQNCHKFDKNQCPFVCLHRITAQSWTQ